MILNQTIRDVPPIETILTFAKFKILCALPLTNLRPHLNLRHWFSWPSLVILVILEWDKLILIGY